MIGVDLPHLRVPLLRMSRIEGVVQLLALDALLGHDITGRSENLVLGIYEALAGPDWTEVYGQLGAAAIGNRCAVCQLGGSLQPSTIDRLVGVLEPGTTTGDDEK